MTSKRNHQGLCDSRSVFHSRQCPVSGARLTRSGDGSGSTTTGGVLAPAGSFVSDSCHCLTERLLRGSHLTVGSVRWGALGGQERSSTIGRLPVASRGGVVRVRSTKPSGFWAVRGRALRGASPRLG